MKFWSIFKHLHHWSTSHCWVGGSYWSPYPVIPTQFLYASVLGSPKNSSWENQTIITKLPIVNITHISRIYHICICVCKKYAASTISGLPLYTSCVSPIEKHLGGVLSLRSHLFPYSIAPCARAAAFVVSMLLRGAPQVFSQQSTCVSSHWAFGCNRSIQKWPPPIFSCHD